MVTASDIARLAGVGKAAVSNWRRRFPDFPRAVAGTASSPQFSLEAVTDWLERHDRGVPPQAEDRVWPLIRNSTDELGRGELLQFLGAALLVHRDHPDKWAAVLADPDRQWPPLVEHIRKSLPGTPPLPWYDRWSAVVSATVELAVANGHRHAFEHLVARHQETPGRRAAPVAPELATLIVDLALQRSSAQRLFDPACGFGGLLLAGHYGGAREVIGVDADPNTAALAGLRLLLCDVEGHVAAGDVLRGRVGVDHSADAVVCDLPPGERTLGPDEPTQDLRWHYGVPPRGEPELAWIQHCLAAVRPDGYVVVTMPVAAASRRSGRRIRGALLRAGALRAVISRPIENSKGASVPDLWLLRRPADGTDPPSEILVADAGGDPDLVRASWSCHVQGGPLPEGSRHVRIIDVLDDDIDVTPVRYVGRPSTSDPAVRQEAYRACLADLRAHLDDAVRLARSLPTPATPRSDFAQVTLNDLVKAGAVSLHRTSTGSEPTSTPVLTAEDVRHRRSPTGRTRPAGEIIELCPGDIVVSPSADPVFVWLLPDISNWGAAFLGPRLLLFRADPDVLDPEFLAGSLRAGLTAHASMLRASASSRATTLRVAVPQLSLAEQRQKAAAYRSLLAVETHLTRIHELSAHLLNQGFTGINDGSIGLDHLVKDDLA